MYDLLKLNLVPTHYYHDKTHQATQNEMNDELCTMVNEI